jgi:hypothetical protein
MRLNSFKNLRPPIPRRAFFSLQHRRRNRDTVRRRALFRRVADPVMAANVSSQFGGRKTCLYLRPTCDLREREPPMVRCPCAAVVQSIDAWGRFASRVSGCLVRLPPKRRPLPRRLQPQASGVCPPDSDILARLWKPSPRLALSYWPSRSSSAASGRRCAR